MEVNGNCGNASKQNSADRGIERGNGRQKGKVAIAIALAAAFVIGAFAGYGASSFGIWKHNGRATFMPCLIWCS